MKKFRYIFMAAILMASLMTTRAQEVSMSLNGAQGMFIPKNESVRNMISSRSIYFYGANVAWTASGDSVSLDDDVWGRPTLEGGVLIGDYHRMTLHDETLAYMQNVGYRSRLGYLITPYVGFRRPLLNTGKVKAGYKFENGIGICTAPYDTKENVENFLVGGRLSIFLGMGLYGEVRLSKHLSLGVDATFRHYSNGRTTQPNVGVNTVDLGLKAIYTLEADTCVRTPYMRGFNKGFQKHLYMDVNVGWCPQALCADWNYDYMQAPENRRTDYSVYNAWAAEVGLMWRYSRKYASGIGLDYTYVPFTDDILASEAISGIKKEYEPSKHVLGVSLRHEVFYKNISMHASLGVFLQKKLGTTADVEQTPYYETVGLRWYMPFARKKFYLGYNINACAIKANYFQFSLGCRIQ